MVTAPDPVVIVRFALSAISTAAVEKVKASSEVLNVVAAVKFIFSPDAAS